MSRPPRSSPPHGFTLVELLVVMAVIAILAALTLQISGFVQKKSAMARASSEIKAMEVACESYKADNGIYPRDNGASQAQATDLLDARASGDPASTGYKSASQYLYTQLSGDTNYNGAIDTAEKNNKVYMEMKPTMLLWQNPSTRNGNVLALSDPWGGSYGYSTANQKWVEGGSTGNVKGYNSTFDLWSTAGKNTTPDPSAPATDVTVQWIKNW
jgi:prepilin-type N-terminal cleavage/methylation domain-containing protein